MRHRARTGLRVRGDATPAVRHESLSYQPGALRTYTDSSAATDLAHIDEVRLAHPTRSASPHGATRCGGYRDERRQEEGLRKAGVLRDAAGRGRPHGLTRCQVD